MNEIAKGDAKSQSQTSYQHIGKKTPLLSSRDKVTGQAKYTDDIKLTNALHVAFVRSIHASATIKNIDTAKAKELAGVRSILTGRDFTKTFGVLPVSRDEPALAKDRVRYVGEPVVAIAAETSKIACAAAELVSIDYETIQRVLDPNQALQPTPMPIHPELGKSSNVHKSVTQEFGSVENGFKKASVIVEDKFDFAPLNHAFTEPFATQVEINEQGITVYCATQVPHYVHLALSEVLELPSHRIRVIKPHVGGGFGGKSDPLGHEIVCAKMALVTGRNIRMVLGREEVFFVNHGRHPTQMTMKLGMHEETGITAVDADILIDGGAYGSFGVVTTYYNGVLLQGPYVVPNSRFHCDRVYTNKPMCGAMRGHGGVNSRFAIEALIDMACHKLKIDPCKARLKMIRAENSITANEFRITSCGLKHGLVKAMEKTNWPEKYQKLPYGKGIGVACGFFISGSALAIHRGEMPQSQVRLTIDFDGAITLYSGASDIGQGSDTMLTQMVAEVLGVSLSQITVISADTKLCPVDLGSYSSRVTFMAGNAARNAAIRMRRMLVESACAIMGIKPPVTKKPRESADIFALGQQPPRFDDEYLGPNCDYEDGFVFQNGKVFAPHASDKAVAFADVVQHALGNRGMLEACGIYISPVLGGKFKGAGAGLSPSYSFTACISEVTVDASTGFVKVDKVTCAHDCGMPLNPLAVEGQIEGSIHMGLGQALMEETRYIDGIVQNGSFLDYKILSPFEQPEISTIYDLSVDKEGPFGAKEVGEGVLAPVIPSVANAIFDAVGVRLTSVPMTPDKVLSAIRMKGAPCIH